MRRLFAKETGSEHSFQSKRHTGLRLSDAHPPWWALVCVVALALALAATPAAASASQAAKILEACSNGTEPVGYSQQAYNQAIKQMEAFLSEYTDCPDLIHKAELAGAVGTHGARTAAGPSEAGTAAVAPPTKAEQDKLESIPHASAPPVKVGTEVIHPGVMHVNLASAVNTLPTPLLALLAFLLACALLAIAWVVRQRIRRAGGNSISDD